MDKKRYVYYHIKAALKRRSTWAVIISLLFLIWVISGIHLPSALNMKLGIFTNGSRRAEKMLSDAEGGFEYIRYGSKEELVRDVKAGVLECGFLLSEDFDECVSEGKTKETVEYIASNFTTGGAVAKENFYALFLRDFGKDIVLGAYDDMFEDIGAKDDGEVKEYLTERYAFYADGNGIFTVDFR